MSPQAPRCINPLLVLPAIDCPLLPLGLHILSAVLASVHATHSNLALPHILITVLAALLTHHWDLYVLLDTRVGLQIRANLQAVDDCIVWDSLQVNRVKDVAVVDALVLEQVLWWL